MAQPLSDKGLPLKLRTTAADMALALANAMAEYGPDSVQAHAAYSALTHITADIHICMRAGEILSDWEG